MSMIGSTKKANELIKNHHDKIKDSANYVYMLKSEGNVVYVGKTRSIRTRLANHVSDKHFDSFSVIECAERNMGEIEVHYIKKHTPKYNKKDHCLPSILTVDVERGVFHVPSFQSPVPHP